MEKRREIVWIFGTLGKGNKENGNIIFFNRGKKDNESAQKHEADLFSTVKCPNPPL